MNSSKTWATIYQLTWHHILKDLNQYHDQNQIHYKNKPLCLAQQQGHFLIEHPQLPPHPQEPSSVVYLHQVSWVPLESPALSYFSSQTAVGLELPGNKMNYHIKIYITKITIISHYKSTHTKTHLWVILHSCVNTRRTVDHCKNIDIYLFNHLISYYSVQVSSFIHTADKS